MRRGFIPVLVSLSLIALVGVGLWWKGILAPRPTERRDRANGEALRPELTLSVNGSRRTAITQGTPLVFEVMLRNGVAARAAGEAQARERLKEELEERVQAGELVRAEADEVLSGEPVPPPVPALVITLRAEGFSFRQNGPRGDAPLPWQPKLVDPVFPTPATLDATRTISASFLVAPEETASAARETYRTRVHFENRSPGQWQGTITSNPVVITIAAVPRVPMAQDQKKQHFATVEYYLTLKQYDRALDAARKALSVHPQSIDGLALLGKAQEAKGESGAALNAYEKALEEFQRRHPDADHPPESLMRGIWRMRGKLGIEVPAR